MTHFSRVGCFTQEYRGNPFLRIIVDKVGVEYSIGMFDSWTSGTRGFQTGYRRLL